MGKTAKNIVGIHWVDVHTYRNNTECYPTPMYTIVGSVSQDTEEYIVVKDPETIRFTEEGASFPHPEEPPRYYFIPKGFIKELVYDNPTK